MAGSNRRFRGAGSPEIAAAISTALAMAGAASAQAPAEEEAGGLNEVIVTATKRAENLQDVPESITALDGNAIAVRGLQQMDDLVRSVPGLSLGTREPAGTTIVFRGVASSGLSFGSVSSSALYLDEQPITSSGRNPDPRFIDIERIEALRGPQGSLYGASSQSGTLRVITNKADSSGFEAWAEAQANGVREGGNGHDLSAMVNVPLVADKLALRLVGFTSEDAGYIDNVLSPSLGGTYDNADVVDEDVNRIKTKGGRASLRWDATDDVNLTLNALFQDVRADGHGDVSLDGGDLEQVRFSEESMDDKWYQLALTLNASLPFGEATVTASYFDRKFEYEADATAYEFGFNQSGYVVYDFGGDPRGFATNNEKTHITALEARLQSRADSESRWGWIAGAFYSRETGTTAFDSYVRGYADTPSFEYFSEYEANLTGSPLAPTDRWFLGRYDTELEQKAVFGELSYDITERFTITAGGRWFDYSRDNAQQQRQPEGFSGYTLLDVSRQSSEDGFVKKLNLTYEIDRNRMVYATFSEGFRVGGANQLKPASALPSTYESDTLTNYEVGAKTEWLDNRLRVNLAVYDMKWDNFAVQIEDPQPGVFQLGFVNLPSATIRGIEADFVMSLAEGWELDGTFSRNDTQTEAANFVVESDDGETYAFPVAEGSRLPLTPDWSASLGLEYRPQARLLGARPFARLDYSYVGDSVNALEGIEAVVGSGLVALQENYQVGDVRFGLEGEHWQGSIFVDNISDERAQLYVNNRWNAQRLSINRPRTIGIQVRYNF
jgi:iron complex outermembrane receptor protein